MQSSEHVYVQLLGGLQHVSASFTPQCSELQNNVSAFAFNPKFSPKLVQTAVSVGTEVVVSVEHLAFLAQHSSASDVLQGSPLHVKVAALVFKSPVYSSPPQIFPSDDSPRVAGRCLSVLLCIVLLCIVLQLADGPGSMGLGSQHFSASF